jgi:hypothetical protein
VARWVPVGASGKLDFLTSELEVRSSAICSVLGVVIARRRGRHFRGNCVITKSFNPLAGVAVGRSSELSEMMQAGASRSSGSARLASLGVESA